MIIISDIVLHVFLSLAVTYIYWYAYHWNQISYSIGQDFIQIVKYFQHNIQLRTIKRIIHIYSDLLFWPSKFHRHFCTNPGLQYQGWQGICRLHRCRSLLMPKYVLRARLNAFSHPLYVVCRRSRTVRTTRPSKSCKLKARKKLMNIVIAIFYSIIELRPW